MQACQMCETADVDAGGYCAGCGRHLGLWSYATYPPAADVPRYDPAPAPRSDGGSVYFAASASVHQPAVDSYPVSPSAPPYPQDAHVVDETPPDPRARGPLTTMLFLLTVTVVVLVAGAITVALFRYKDRNARPDGGTAQRSPTAVNPPSAGPSSAAASAASAAFAVDRCVVGEWTVTKWSVRYPKVDLTTDAGGTLRLAAGATGTWDFGGGSTLTGTISGTRSEVLIAGRVDFGFQTAGQALSFQNVGSDVRQVINQEDEKATNGLISFQLEVAEYICVGDTLRLKTDQFDVQAGRK